MGFRSSFLLLLSAVSMGSHGQVNQDSIRILNEVTVKAYAYDRPAREVPSALGLIAPPDLNRFSNISFLPIVNTVPGVKMEERSPGSYRFAIRGSSLRSPFGIRNVKFYWNGLPLTDGSGNTYFNLIDFNAISGMEIIKGPGASLYGAGSGGVVLLQQTRDASEGMHLQYSLITGSYGLFRLEAGGKLIASKNFKLDARISYMKSDGYRQQTKIGRSSVTLGWTNLLSSKSFLTGSFLVMGLNYGTPGGLTLAQYDADPSQARPPSGGMGGAVSQQAKVNNSTQYLGLNFDHQWSDAWSTRIGGFGSLTKFINPTIRNYEKRNEYNWGGRTDTQFKFEKSTVKGKVTFGAEYQNFYSTLTDYDNLSGVPGDVQTDDELRSELFLAFGQVDLEFPKGYFVTLGGSENYNTYNFLRLSDIPQVEQKRVFDPVFSPRIALLKRFSSAFSAYGNISSGFSPPSLAEVRPSTSTFNNSLNAEQGTSYELGAKGMLFGQLEFNVAVYSFGLNNAIVVQQDPTGADYFVNAGATSQKGYEIYLSWFPKLESDKFNQLRLWTSYTNNYYRFTNYINSGVDLSGKALTGVAPNILVAGIDLQMKKGFYMNVTTNYTDRIPLNDANSEYAADYFLLGGRFGYKISRRIPLELFVGIDNALDRRYSLGNDLNAAGGKYYNAAMPRNYYTGLIFHLITIPVKAKD